MYSTAFEEIAIDASKLLNDSDGCNPEYDFTRWSKHDLVRYAQDAVSMIYMLAPKKFTDCKSLTLKAGTVQKLPENCVKLTKVLGVNDNNRVSSSNVSVVNERLGAIFPRGCAESLNPNNYELTGYSLEPSSDNIFYVQPPVPLDDTVTIDVICSCQPDVTDKDYVPEGWMRNAIIEWVLYRAYSSEDEAVQAANMATMHLQHFYTIMQNFVQMQMSLAEIQEAVNLGGRNAAT